MPRGFGELPGPLTLLILRARTAVALAQARQLFFSMFRLQFVIVPLQDFRPEI